MFSRSRELFFVEIIFLIIFLLLCLPAISQLPEGKQLFTVHCSACHTLGQGKLIGPDLSGIMLRRDRDWVIRFIHSSQTMISNGDKSAVEVFETFDKLIMPDQTGLSDSQIDAILVFLNDPEQRKANTSATTAQNQEILNIDPVMENVNRGRDLFNGNIMLVSDGPACISCHNVTEGNGITGGQLAPDLTNVYSRIDESMIMELATNPRYPSMQKVYLDKPITPREAALLASYLRYAGTGSTYQLERDRRAADFLKRINSSGQQ